MARCPTFATSAGFVCCHVNSLGNGVDNARGLRAGDSVIIFDCNGVLVDSERIAAAVAAEEFTRIGIALTPELVARFFFGRRPADMIAMVETAGRCKLPASFSSRLAGATLSRLRAEVRAMPHAAYALTWLRGPKCLASSSPLDRVGVSLETTGLARFFTRVFSASEVPKGKPAPDLFLHAAAQMQVEPDDCIVVEDSPAGVTAATAAGMTAIGFVGGSHAGGELGHALMRSGARTVLPTCASSRASWPRCAAGDLQSLATIAGPSAWRAAPAPSRSFLSPISSNPT